jgi:pimeloyl-ACP methyl ester carboxylesterase
MRRSLRHFVGALCLLSFLLSPGQTRSQTLAYPPDGGAGGSNAEGIIMKPGTYLNYMASYGTLIVPENRRKRDSRLIRLPVIKIHSTSQEPVEPVFYLTGGPGFKNVPSEDVLLKAGQRDLGNLGFLLERHDVILTGYRGAEGSVVLDCPEVVDALKGTTHPLSSRNLAILGSALSSAYQRLIKAGIDIDGYTIVDVVDDLDTVRKGFHYETVDLWGEGYGATVAYMYGLKFPKHVCRSLLTGAQPLRFMDAWRPEIIDRQIKYYSRLWRKDQGRTDRVPDLGGMMRSVLEKMPARWEAMNLDADKVRLLSFLFLADTGSAAQVFDAFVGADKGDYGKLAYLTEAFDKAFPTSTVWGDFYSKVLSVQRPDPGVDYEAVMDPAASVLGSPLAKLLFGCLKYGSWPMALVPEEFREPRYSDVETLLVGGNLDLLSPVDLAKNELLPYLRKGKLVVLSDMGHDDITGGAQPSAFRHLIGTFFLTGTADDSPYKYQPMDFTPSQPFLKWLFGLGKGLSRVE